MATKKKAPVKKKVTSKKKPAVKKSSTSKKKTTPASNSSVPKKDPAPVVPLKKVLYVTYAKYHEQPIFELPGEPKKVNRVLLGSYLSVTSEKTVQGEKWLEVFTYGVDGWVPAKDTTKDKHLKLFYIDVGQGDGALMEVGDETFLFDGGPREDDNVARFLNWQYQAKIKKGKKVLIDHIFISHFDEDHYGGLIKIINDKNYSFDTIYVAGIGKFKAGKRDTTLGDKDGNILTTYFDDIDDLQKKFGKDGQVLMIKFLNAVKKAKSEGRLKNGIKRLCIQQPNENIKIFSENKKINGLPFNIQVLGPIFKERNGVSGFEYLKDESHTVNGHSLLLKINYGTRTIMFGGDLNTQAEVELLEFYKNNSQILEVDVAKSCHHGASEFTEEFMAKLNPLSTVISSGDNEKYSHPRADAIGCAGKYTKSKRPLVFSTELARSVNVPTQKIQYGMINLRCDGEKIYFAQKKEAKSPSDPWDSYGPL